jgi:hypothetical protein
LGRGCAQSQQQQDNGGVQPVEIHSGLLAFVRGLKAKLTLRRSGFHNAFVELTMIGIA